MSESLPGGPKILTHPALTASVKSLHSVGGLYEQIAQYVEYDNRPHCASAARFYEVNGHRVFGVPERKTE